MKPNFFLKSLLGAVLLSFLYWAGSQISGTGTNTTGFAWNLLSNFLVALVIGYYIMHSNHRGWKLSALVFAVFFIIGHFNILIEALIFNVTDQSQTLKALFSGFLVTAIFAPLFVYLLNQWKGKTKKLEFEIRSPLSWTWRILLSDVLYFLFYLIAGFTLQAVYPQLLDFYADKIPPFPLIFKTQFLRGFIFAGIAILVLRTTSDSRFKKALLIGLLFSILGGIAPLIPPNPHMPTYIRLGHGFEVGISNFLYGFTIAYLLGSPTTHFNLPTAHLPRK